MKKGLFFLLFSLLTASSFARVVDLNESTMIAFHFFGEEMTKSDSPIIRVTDFQISGGRNEPCFYIFNHSRAHRFVIIAGDTNVAPILAYSNQGTFDGQNLPPNLSEWLRQINDYILDQRISGEEGVAEQAWAQLAEAPIRTKSETGVLYETAEWGQGYPFNSRCPTVGGNATLTGCTAVAYAIYLRYYKHPAYGTGQSEPYSYVNEKGIQVNAEIVSYERPFLWDDMPLKYSTSWSASNLDNVADLVYLCGLAAESEFATNEAGGTSGYPESAHRAMQRHMHYDKSSLFHSRVWYEDGTWTAMMKNHLDNTGPLLYSARSKSAGHCFVIDGYDTQMNFHINWGWNGGYNGYYALPEFMSYKYEHQAALGMQPDKGGAPVQMLVLTNTGGRTGITFDSGEEPAENKLFTISCGYLKNQSVETPFNGQICAVTIDRNGNFKEYASSNRKITLESGFGLSSIQLSCLITKELEVGDRITLYQKNADEDIWKPVLFDRENVVGELPVYDQLYIDEATSVRYAPLENKLTIRTKKGVSFSLESNGTKYCDGLSDNDIPIIIDTESLPAGKYTLSLKKRKELKTVNLIL